MGILEAVVEIGNRYVWEFPAELPWMVVALLSAGFIVTVRLGGIQVRKLRHAFAVVSGKYDDPDDPGDVTHFQALSTALSATVGIGNIAGVATAIHYGGPGSVFWMWVTAVFGMALKFAESTLAVEYRDFDDRGEVAGGPMYYISKGMGSKWTPMAFFFAFCAVFCSFGSGNMNQSNSVRVSAATEFGLDPHFIGVVVAIVVGLAILGGIKSIARVTSRLAPGMAVFYIAAALTILLMNFGEIPSAFGTIISNAFNPQAGVGGSVAGVFSVSMLWGIRRGLFSNEAGQGTAPIAHAAAKTDEPVREGVVAMLGPFIDTLIICTMTALVIVITGVWDKKRDTVVPLERATHVVAAEGATHVDVVDGIQPAVGFEVSDGPVDEPVILRDGQPFTGTIDIADGALAPAAGSGEFELRGMALQNSSALTAWAFEEGLGPLGGWGGLIVTIAVFLFGISTMISWSYYGDRAITYLIGTRAVLPYRFAYVGFVYLGAVLSLEVVWAYGDLMIGLMTLPNLIAVVVLLPRVRRLTSDYFSRMRDPTTKNR